jgi:septal ring factor EnvC (AmiA/AmiB activator)
MEQSPPPKRLKNQLVHLDHNLKQIERQQYAGIQRADNALPVLEAFQRFLDNERARMRRRLVTVSAALLLVVGLGAAAGLVAVQMLAQRVARGEAASTERVRGLAATVAASTSASEGALQAIEDELAHTRRALLAEQAMLGSSQSNIAATVAGYQASIEALQALATKLRRDNSTLQVQLEEMGTRWPEVTNLVAELRSRLPDGHGAERSPTREASVGPGVTHPVLPQPAAVAGPTISLAIVPQGQTHPIRWQLPSITTE